MTALGAVALGAGLGLILGAALGSSDRRALFTALAREHLAKSHVTLLGAELGRNAGAALWIMTVRLPTEHVLTIQVPVNASHDPLSLETAGGVTSRVLNYLHANHLIAA